MTDDSKSESDSSETEFSLAQTRFDAHYRRKGFHFLSGSLVSYLLVARFEREESLIFIVGALIILGGFDLFRLNHKGFNHFVLSRFGFLMRKGEETRPTAQFYYLIGLVFAIGFLPKPVAIQSILTLAWMDPVAALVGVNFGKHKWVDAFAKWIPFVKAWPKSVGAKSIEGSLAGFAVAFIAGIVAWTGYWAAVSLPGGALIWPEAHKVILFSAVGALTAMIAESWPSQWDDNANITFWTGLSVLVTAKLIGHQIS